MELDFSGLFVTTDPLGQVAINPAKPYPFLQFGSTSGSNAGILFTASANQPAGYSGGQVGKYHSPGLLLRRLIMHSQRYLHRANPVRRKIVDSSAKINLACGDVELLMQWQTGPHDPIILL